MASSLTKVLLFVSSYLPLWLVVFVLYVHDHRGWAIAVLVVGLASVLVLFQYLKHARNLAAVRFTVARARRCDADALTYIVSYLVPFLALPTDGWQKVTAMAMFYVILGYLYVKTDMIHVNPTLLLAGYRIYMVEDETGHERCVITKSRLAPRRPIEVVNLADNLALEKGHA